MKINKIVAIFCVAALLTLLGYLIPQTVATKGEWFPTSTNSELAASVTDYKQKGYPLVVSTLVTCGANMDCPTNEKINYFMLLGDFVIWLFVVFIVSFLTGDNPRKARK